MPKCIIILSGKRKSGKDYVADLLKKQITSTCSILTLSSPLKLQYAQEHGLDYQRLMSSFDYKEKYREAMIKWGEQKRAEDSGWSAGFFARIVTATPAAISADVWIISDARRHTDLAFFFDNYAPSKLRLLRVVTPQGVRVQRGFQHTKGVDDVPSECDLDNYTFKHLLNNDGVTEVCKLREYVDTLNWVSGLTVDGVTIG